MSPTTVSLLARVSRRLPLVLLRRHLAAGAILVVLAVVYGRTLAPSITWANSGADSGDLVTAAAVLGVAHPTGYPTYLLLAGAFQRLPLGDLAFRSNLLSLAAALLAAGLAAQVVRTACGGSSGAAPSAALTALALGLSPIFWSQAVIAEVHSLNALFTAALLLFALHESRPAALPPASAWPARGRALLAGLALGNHVTIGIMVLAWLAAVAAAGRPGRRWRAVAQRLPWIGAGLMVYAYLPLRAAAQPAISWGGASDLAGFWWVVSGAPYRGLAFGLPVELLPQRAEAWAAMLLQQFGPAGLLFGLGGLCYSAVLRRAERLGGALVAGAYSLFALLYDTADSYAYLLPACVVFAIWIGCGAHQALTVVGRLRPAALCAVAGCAVLLLAQGAATWRQVDASQDRRAITFATVVMRDAPAQAILVTESDADSFPLWYAHFALGNRPDTAVVVGPLLDFAWYRANVRVRYPGLSIPDALPESWAEHLAEVNRGRPVCTIQDLEPVRLACGQR